MVDVNKVLNNTNSINRFRSLDSFRGMAILWIVCFHILVTHREGYGKILDLIVKNGHLGVEVFFIVSGFGISMSVHRSLANNDSPLVFLKKRLSRIYLPYFFSLFFAALIIPVLSTCVSTLKGHTLTFNFYEYSFIDWIYIITLLKVFTSESWALNQSFLPINGVVWYIAIIVQIYFVVAFAMLFKTYYYRIILSVSILSGLTLIPEINSLIPYGLFLPYWLEFLVGILLFAILNAGYYLKPNLAKFTKVYLWSLIIYIIVSSLLLYLKFSNILFCSIVGILFWFIYPLDNLLAKTKCFRFFSNLGLFSYSLYLMHIPFWPFVNMFVRNLCPVPQSISAPLILIPLIIVLSFFWYLFFEKPGSIRGILFATKNPYKKIIF